MSADTVSTSRHRERSRRPPSAGRRTLSRVIRVVLALCALALVAGGGVALSASGGYVQLAPASGPYRTAGYALTTDGWDAGSALFGSLATVRVHVTPTDDRKPVFVGVAPTDEIRRYLTDVQYTAIHEVAGDQPTSASHAGHAPTTRPGDTQLWDARSSGLGGQTVVWRVRSGTFSLVVLNADGSPSVGGRFSTSATIPSLRWVGIALLGCGLLLAGRLTYVSRRSVPAAR